MAKLDWMYHRKNCQTCQKTDGYLAREGISVNTVVDCKKEPMTFSEARGLLEGVRRLYATKGTKVVEVYMASKPADPELISLMIGPSGKLRAPTIKNGDVLVIGFNEDMYGRALAVKK